MHRERLVTRNEKPRIVAYRIGIEANIGGHKASINAGHKPSHRNEHKAHMDQAIEAKRMEQSRNT